MPSGVNILKNKQLRPSSGSLLFYSFGLILSVLLILSLLATNIVLAIPNLYYASPPTSAPTGGNTTSPSNPLSKVPIIGKLSNGNNMAKATSASGSNATSVLNVVRNTTSTITLSKNVGDTYEYATFRPSIAVSGSNVYVVWRTGTFVNDSILLTKSTDGGATFNDPVKINSIAGAASSPQIAVSGSNVYVVWIDSTDKISDIVFKRMVS